MNIYGRFVGLAVSLVLMGALGVTVGAEPASATVTTLCKGYTACARAGMSANGYASAGTRMYWRMYSGHNCTNYAAYRMVQSGMANTRPWTGSGNATNWGSAMSRITNGTPAVGAVAWWRANVSPAGRSGHVAYVERVVSADEIIVSMDSWGGDFSWARVTRASRGWPSGFVHFHDVRQLNTKAPSITGTAKVGSVLSASPGSWNPSGATMSYQWAQDGVYISGATASTLPLTRSNEAKKMTVRVTARHLGYPSVSVISAPTVAVQPGALTNTSPPTVIGDPRVNATLSASPGGWSPTPDRVNYQWFADRIPVHGATAPTLAVDPALANKKISVRTTATKTGYAAVPATSATTVAVMLGTLTMSTTPTLTGIPRLGQTLTLHRPRSSPRPATTVQWLRSGVAIPGATSSTYRITSADLGSRVAARVRLTRSGYTSVIRRTSWTSQIRSTPVVRVATSAGTRRLALRASVRARGVDAVNTVIKVRTRGTQVGTVRVRNGIARTTLTHLRPGTRMFHFRLTSTATTDGRVWVRRIRIG